MQAAGVNRFTHPARNAAPLAGAAWPREPEPASQEHQQSGDRYKYPWQPTADWEEAENAGNDEKCGDDVVHG
jgi:hypothetical protein